MSVQLYSDITRLFLGVKDSNAKCIQNLIQTTLEVWKFRKRRTAGAS